MSADSAEAEQRKRSQMIDRKLEEDSRRLRRECKILLLGELWFPCLDGKQSNPTAGSGESGKSTIVKQMKIIHQNGYTKDELALYRLTIYKNLVDCTKALISAMRQFDMESNNPRTRSLCDYILNYEVDPDPHTPLDSKVGDSVTIIWKDASIATVLEHQSEFYMMDSAP